MKVVVVRQFQISKIADPTLKCEIQGFELENQVTAHCRRRILKTYMAHAISINLISPVNMGAPSSLSHCSCSTFPSHRPLFSCWISSTHTSNAPTLSN